MSLVPGDLLVEYRDRNLNRRGAIPIDDLNLKVQPVLNGIGSWSVTIPAEHRAADYLRAPGAGIIITNIKTGRVIMSGSSSKPSKKASSSDQLGMVTIAGLSDDRLLWDAWAQPQPSNPDIEHLNAAYDTITGDAETVMRHYVDVNIGPSAPSFRKTGSFREFIALQATNHHYGVSVSKSARFDYVGDILSDIATLAGLRFRMVQTSSTKIEFQVERIEDKRAFIRLDIVNGTLQEQSLEFAPPTSTRIAVAGQGEGADRQFRYRTNATAAQAEEDWGLIIEKFKDQRNTDVVAELDQSGDEILANEGFTRVAVKASPSNDQTMVYQHDFDLGDLVTVVVDGQESSSTVTEAAIVCTEGSLHTAVAIGDIADFDKDSALRKTVTDTERRVSNLERNEGSLTVIYNIDGGKPDTKYGGVDPIDGGGV